MIKNYLTNLKQEFSGYYTAKLMKDIMAGLTVCAVALPLALAFGVSSGATAAAGLVTAIIAGVVIAVLGGASFQISGPTGAMSAVLVGIVASYGLQGVFFACFAAGALLLLAGIFKLGRLISFIPMPVIMGLTSGIAIIIAMGQIDNLFGTASEGSSNLAKIASYARLGFHPNLQAVLIGLLVVVVMIVWPKKWGARVPGSLVGIILATVVSALFRMDSIATVGDIPRTLMLADRLDLGSLNLNMLKNLISPIVTIAALGMIESLLCGASASRMKNEPFNADQEVIAQGVGNILLPLFGLPLVSRILFLHQLPNFTADSLLLHACHPAYLSKVNITLNLTVQLCKDFRRLCGKANPVLRIFEIIFALYAGNFKGYIMHSIHQQLGKFRCALCLDKFIGILSVRHLCHLHMKAVFHQYGNGAKCGIGACLIAVIQQNHIIRKALQRSCMLLIEGCSQ